MLAYICLMYAFLPRETGNSPHNNVCNSADQHANQDSSKPSNFGVRPPSTENRDDIGQECEKESQGGSLLKPEIQSAGMGIRLAGVDGTSAVTANWQRELDEIIKDRFHAVIRSSFSELDEAEGPGGDRDRAIDLAEGTSLLLGGRRVELEIHYLRRCF